MVRKQYIIVLLGVGVVAAWPIASEAVKCPTPPPKYVHKKGIGGSNEHTCLRITAGSVLAEILTEEHPGKVTLTVRPQGRTGPACGGDDDDATTTSATSTTGTACGGDDDDATTTSTTSTPEPPVEALLVCRTNKSTCLVKIPASIPEFSNTTSTTEKISPDKFRTTLRANPTPAQLLRLKRFCPGCANRKGKPVNYLPLDIRAILAFETGAKFDLNAKGGNCTVNFGDLTVGPTGKFNRIPYGGGCAPALGNEYPYEEPPPTRHGEPKAKSRHQ